MASMHEKFKSIYSHGLIYNSYNSLKYQQFTTSISALFYA